MSPKQKFILLCLSIFFMFFLVTGKIPVGYGSTIRRDTDLGSYWLIMLGFAALILFLLYRFLIAWSKRFKIK
jgi:hypothetical protein